MSSTRLRVLVAVAVVTLVVGVFFAGCRRGAETNAPTAPGNSMMMHNAPPAPTEPMPAANAAPGQPADAVPGAPPEAVPSVPGTPPSATPGAQPPAGPNAPKGPAGAKGAPPPAGGKTPAKPTSTSALDPVIAKHKSITSYKETTVTDRGTRTMMVKLHDGKPVRTRSTMGDAGDWMLVMTDKKMFYRYSSKDKVVQKMAQPSGEGRGPGGGGQGAGSKGGPGAGQKTGGRGLLLGRSVDLEDLEKNVTAIMPEKVDGMDCLRLDVRAPQGGTLKLWVDKQYGLVRQSQTGDSTIKHSYSEINAVPDSNFELPAGVKVVDAPPFQPGQGGMGGGKRGGGGGGGRPGGA